jgi:hypothetical protein
MQQRKCFERKFEMNSPVRPEVVTEVMKNIGLALQEKEATGEEYMCILHNLAAHVLSENPKKLEKDFFAQLKTDVLRRRLKKLKAEQSKLEQEVLAEGEDSPETTMWIDEAANFVSETLTPEITEAEKQAYAESISYATNQGEEQ